MALFGTHSQAHNPVHYFLAFLVKFHHRCISYPPITWQIGEETYCLCNTCLRAVKGINQWLQTFEHPVDWYIHNEVFYKGHWLGISANMLRTLGRQGASIQQSATIIRSLNLPVTCFAMNFDRTRGRKTGAENITHLISPWLVESVQTQGS